MSERFNDLDFSINSFGDLELSNELDINLVENTEYVAQSVLHRLKAIDIDWYYDALGANLEGFLGQPNTQDNAKKIEDNIISVLTEDGLCDIDDLLVISTPIEDNSVIIGVFVKIDEEISIEYIIDINFLTGFNITRKDIE